jgi:hypothetical protein
MRKLGVIPIVFLALTVAACTTSAPSLGTGKHGTLSIEVSACWIPPAIDHETPPFVPLTIHRLGGGTMSRHVVALIQQRFSVPAGQYVVAEPGVKHQGSVNATVEKGRTTSVVVPSVCK